MLWLILFTISLVFVMLAQRLKAPNEVVALALYVMGLFSGLWGFAIAPILAQLILGLLALGGVQMRSLPTRFANTRVANTRVANRAL